MPAEKRAIIIGAGPAGLTAAYELLTRTDIKPVILEKSEYAGGISRTVKYKANRIDVGGHRFFSKSDRVMDWWLNIMPVEPEHNGQLTIQYQNQSKQYKPTTIASDEDKVMLVRNRVSHIYYLKKFFNYPISLSVDTLRKLGVVKTFRIFGSYVYAKLFPIKKEKTLEQFFINRFGRELYETFFKSYTEKVWGVPCSEISSEWGAQRIKKLNIAKAMWHALRGGGTDNVKQKNTETSLIEKFLYPKYGPGQIWEEVARRVVEMGGEIYYHKNVTGINAAGQNIKEVKVTDRETGKMNVFEGDYVFSTMPVKELVKALHPLPPADVRQIADGLIYRDFMTVGLLVNELLVKDETAANKLIKDTWIYIQEPTAKMGRLQIFNNWSPGMVSDKSKVWIGVEYFCNRGDELWSMTDEEVKRFATDELANMRIIRREDVLDGTVIRDENTYPAYFGTYPQFYIVREYLDKFDNLYLIGRNGMHKYNNSDHSMLTAMTAVDNILNGVEDKSNIWMVNTEQEYHEEK